VARTIALALVVLVVGLALSPSPAEGQATIETQKGMPPDPNTAAPEYKPTPGSPPKPSVIEPTPGKPELAPTPGLVDGRGQPSHRTIFGLRLWFVLVVGLLIVAAVGIRRRARR
jgi:hypothetical protein